MLELVQSLAREGRSEDEIVAAVLELVNSGQVILIGNLRGTPLRRPNEKPIDAEHPSGALGSTAPGLGEAHVAQSLAALGQREWRRSTDETPLASHVSQQKQERTGR